MDKQMAFWSGLTQGSNTTGAQTGTASTTGPGQMAPAHGATYNQMLGAQNAQWMGYPNYPSTVTTTGGLGTYFQPISYPTASVPIFNYDSKEGILLTDKEGKQHFVPIRDIAQSIGLEW